jgi:hypothetical protein
MLLMREVSPSYFPDRALSIFSRLYSLQENAEAYIQGDNCDFLPRPSQQIPHDPTIRRDTCIISAADSVVI